MTRKERSEEMLAHVAAQEQSGTSRKSYCEQHGLKPCVLNYWWAKRRRVAAQGQKGFARVQMIEVAAMELHYPNGVRLLLPGGTALDQVAAFIRLY
jgi:hypothetical protein